MGGIGTQYSPNIYIVLTLPGFNVKPMSHIWECSLIVCYNFNGTKKYMPVVPGYLITFHCSISLSGSVCRHIQKLILQFGLAELFIVTSSSFCILCMYITMKVIWFEDRIMILSKLNVEFLMLKY